MFKEYFDKLLRQLSLDLNCDPVDFLAKENIITVPALNEGRRIYSPDKPFFEMATVGGNTVITADECLHGFLSEHIKGVEGHRLFELNSLMKISSELEKYGYRLAPTHHMFLPCSYTKVEELYPVKWFCDAQIEPFYGDVRFANALSYPVPCPARPDKMMAAAYDGDNIMGASGFSEDGPHWMQIGIDVLPEYRSKGVGTYLVSLVKNKIIEQGDIPFYGTAAANIFSQKIAVNSGFRHAWVEVESYKID